MKKMFIWGAKPWTKATKLWCSTCDIGLKESTTYLIIKFSASRCDIVVSDLPLEAAFDKVDCIS